MPARLRNHCGWGYEDERLSAEQTRGAAEAISAALGFGSTDVVLPVALGDVKLRAARLEIPAALREIASADAHARASHAWGKSYSDIVRAARGDFDHPPDFVVRPRDEREIERVLEWAAAANAAVIPYGGGTSVVGGVEPRVPERFDGAVSLDLSALDRVLEVDPVSRAARIGAGASGPELERRLGEQGFTLRHFPQSFELSTLGGWIATRAGGHFATLWTHIEDLVEAVRAVTPAGIWQSRRLPGSGAGPSPDRMLVGSEGILGVITEAWVRVQPRPQHRSSTGVRFATFEQGVDCTRELSQAGLHPANCRLIDPLEAQTTGAGDGSCALLVLGFESTDHDVAEPMARALAICREHGGDADEPRSGGQGGSVSAWRESFLRAPYLRDTFVAMGVLSDTFETAITWERFAALHERAVEAARSAAGPQARVSCRFTHVYPDGPAPYFTVLAPAQRGDEVEQWAQIKRACSDALIEAGGTITHHHAVGRDHRPWYDRQRPDLFADALRAAKRAIDPAGMLNPGVLIDP